MPISSYGDLSDWEHPTTDLTLRNDEIHVWLAALDVPDARMQELHCLLASDEVERAGRFSFQSDRRHYVVARGLLRCILSHYTKMEPERLLFRHNSFGKPELNGEHNKAVVSFNLSHSHGLALYAVTASRQVGIDLERIRPIAACEKIAKRYFSKWEYAEMAALPSSVWREAFLACWTRKEAYIKARGEGLSISLCRFSVSVAPDEPARLVEIMDEMDRTSNWSLYSLIPAPGYIAAVAIKGCDFRLKCSRYGDWVKSK